MSTARIIETAKRFQKIIIEIAERDSSNYKFRTLKGKSELDIAARIVFDIAQIDIDPHKKNLTWLAREYILRHYRLEDKERIQEVLTDFKAFKGYLKKKKLSVDILKYSLHELEDLMDEIKGVGIDDEFSINIPDTKVLYDGPYGTLAIPLSKEASQALGRGTKWCTAGENENMFEFYHKRGDLYIWRDKSGKKYQFHFAEMQFMDAKDRLIDQDTLNFFRKDHPVLKDLFAKEELGLAMDPYTAFIYARDVIGGRFEACEDMMKKTSFYAASYAVQVSKQRWSPEEEKIASFQTDSGHSVVSYAKEFIEGRWPELEDYILTSRNQFMAEQYSKEIMNGNWPEAEPLLRQREKVIKKYVETRKRFNELSENQFNG